MGQESKEDLCWVQVCGRSVNSSVYSAQEARARSLIPLEGGEAERTAKCTVCYLCLSGDAAEPDSPAGILALPPIRQMPSQSCMWLVVINFLKQRRKTKMDIKHAQICHKDKKGLVGTLSHTLSSWSLQFCFVLYTLPCRQPLALSVFFSFHIYSLSKSAPILKSDSHNPTVCELLALSFTLASEQFSELALTFP